MFATLFIGCTQIGDSLTKESDNQTSTNQTATTGAVVVISEQEAKTVVRDVSKNIQEVSELLNDLDLDIA